MFHGSVLLVISEEDGFVLSIGQLTELPWCFNVFKRCESFDLRLLASSLWTFQVEHIALVLPLLDG